MSPTVSIILPAYNSAHLIARSIDSVLAQSFQEWELLIIDDGSTDGTGAVAQSYVAREPRIRILTNTENRGVQYTLARGLKEATGELIARIDSDDAWLDHEKLAKQVAFLKTHPDYVLLGTGAIISDEKGSELLRFLPPETDEVIRARLLMKNCFMHASVMFRKDMAIKAGGYDQTEATRHIEDYDLWLKLGSIGKLANLPIYGISFLSRRTAVSAKNRSAQFYRTIGLIKKYKGNYPGYISGLVTAHARYYLYSIFTMLPASFRNMFLRFYKQF